MIFVIVIACLILSLAPLNFVVCIFLQEPAARTNNGLLATLINVSAIITAPIQLLSRLILDGSPQFAAQSPTNIKVSDLGTILQALFGFSIGLGIVFALTKFVRTIFAGLEARAQKEVKRASDLTRGIDDLTPAEWYREVVSPFLRGMRRQLRFVEGTVYATFFFTASVAGLLMMLSPWHPNLALYPELEQPFVLFTIAPFVQTLALIVIWAVSRLFPVCLFPTTRENARLNHEVRIQHEESISAIAKIVDEKEGAPG